MGRGLDTALPPPIDGSFRPAAMPGWCSQAWYEAPDFTFWRVEPMTDWEVAEELTCPLAPSWLRHEVALDPGVRLTLVAIYPCRDPNGACVWQLAESAHAFRVESGPHRGSVIEIWGSANRVPSSVRAIEPEALVTFVEPFPREQPAAHSAVGDAPIS